MSVPGGIDMFDERELDRIGLSTIDFQHVRRRADDNFVGGASIPPGFAKRVAWLSDAAQLTMDFDLTRDGPVLVDLLDLASSDVGIGGSPGRPEFVDSFQPATRPNPIAPTDRCIELLGPPLRLSFAAAALDIAAGVGPIRLNQARELHMDALGQLGFFEPPEGLGGPADGPGGFGFVDPCGYRAFECWNVANTWLDEVIQDDDLLASVFDLGSVEPNCISVDVLETTTFTARPVDGKDLPSGADWVLTFNGVAIPDVEKTSSKGWRFSLAHLLQDGCVSSGILRLHDRVPPAAPPDELVASCRIGTLQPEFDLGPLGSSLLGGIVIGIVGPPSIHAIGIDGAAQDDPDSVDVLKTPHCGVATVDIRWGLCPGKTALGCARFETTVSVAGGLPAPVVSTVSETGEYVRLLVDPCVEEFTVDVTSFPADDPSARFTTQRTFEVVRQPTLDVVLMTPGSADPEQLGNGSDVAPPVIVERRRRSLLISSSCCAPFGGIEVSIEADGLDIAETATIPLGQNSIDVPFLPTGEQASVRVNLTADNHFAAGGYLSVRSARLGIALSGGGAKGSFHAGALAHLDERGLLYTGGGPASVRRARFDIVSGTSIGAITATKLADGSDDATDVMVDVWLSLTSTADMVERADWVAELKTRTCGYIDISGFSGLIGGCKPLPHPDIEPTKPAKKGGGLFGFFSDAVKFLRRAARFGIPDPVVEFGPGPFDNPVSYFEGIANAISTGFCVAKNVGSLEEWLEGTLCEQTGLFTLDPAMELLRSNVDIDGVARSGTSLRLVAVDVEFGRVVTFTEESTMLDPGVEPARFDSDDEVYHQWDVRPLEAAVRASASQPIVHVTPAVRLQQGNVQYEREMYDGGVREVIPIDAAVRAGADDIIVIDLSPEATRIEEDPFLLGLGSTLSRGLELSVTEVEVGDRLKHATNPDLDIFRIDPAFTFVSPYDIDPGLTRINLMHGWLRAHDALLIREEADPELIDTALTTTTEITQLRYRIWECELQLLGWLEKGWRSLELMDIIRQGKWDLYRLVQQRADKVGETSMPTILGRDVTTRERRSDWWRRWERHAGYDVIEDSIFDLEPKSAESRLVDAPPEAL